MVDTGKPFPDGTNRDFHGYNGGMPRFATLLVLLTGCETMMDAVAIPEAHTSLRPRAVVYLLGSSLPVSASWGATCHRSTPFFEFSKHDDSWTVSCKEKPIAIDVRCSRRCRVDPDDTAVDALGSAHAKVTFLELGPMRLRTTTRRLDNGHTDHDTSGPITVVMPDRLELACAIDAARMDACGPDGVRADDPRIFPRAVLAGQPVVSELLLVNGVARDHYDFGVSLATLFPDAARGPHGIEPGVYDVELALGTAHARWKVIAR